MHRYQGMLVHEYTLAMCMEKVEKYTKHGEKVSYHHSFVLQSSIYFLFLSFSSFFLYFPFLSRFHLSLLIFGSAFVLSGPGLQLLTNLLIRTIAMKTAIENGKRQRKLQGLEIGTAWRHRVKINKGSHWMYNNSALHSSHECIMCLLKQSRKIGSQLGVFLALLEKIKASSMGKTEGEKGLMNRPVSCRPCFVAGRYIANAMYSLSKQCVTIGSKERECQMEGGRRSFSNGWITLIFPKHVIQ